MIADTAIPGEEPLQPDPDTVTIVRYTKNDGEFWGWQTSYGGTYLFSSPREALEHFLLLRSHEHCGPR